MNRVRTAVMGGVLAMALWAPMAEAQAVRQDITDIQQDRRDLRADREQLQADRRAGNTDAVKKDLEDIRADRKDLKGDLTSASGRAHVVAGPHASGSSSAWTAAADGHDGAGSASGTSRGHEHGSGHGGGRGK